MDLFAPHTLKLKAWNTQTRLMMRLSSLDVVKGVLFRENHVLLVFTGCHDQLGEEIYDKDLLLWERKKYCVVWDEKENGWSILSTEDRESIRLRPALSVSMTRLGSLFELGLPS